MFANPAASWHHSNQNNAQAPCEHCQGIIRHERWCITCDPIVQYAFGIVLDPDKMTLRDRLILHALGVSWTTNQYQGNSKTY
jgi:hypothetical protein